MRMQRVALVGIHSRENCVDHLSAGSFCGLLIRLASARHVDAVLCSDRGKQGGFVHSAIHAYHQS